MTFAGHVAVSGLTVQFIDNPLLLIGVNLILHPVLDMIPHAEWSTFPKSKTKQILITVTDIGLAIWYLWQLITVIPNQSLLAIGLIAGFWLDILDPISKRWLPRLDYFHRWTHSWPLEPGRLGEKIDWSKTFTGRTPLWLKLAIQYGIVAACYYVLTR